MFETLYYRLPYELRRQLFRLIRPKRFRALQYKRNKPREDQKYTFYPFEKYRCIFVHIPKAAGISICTTLFGNLAGGHDTICKYQKVFSRIEYETYFKFAFVRNPWDRLVSAYRFLCKGGISKADADWAQKHILCYEEFGQFVKEGLRKKSILSFTHFRPQSSFVCIPASEVPEVDFVGYVENIKEEFDTVQKRIFGKVGKHLPALNRNRQTIDYRRYYSEELKEIVADVYSQDIEVFGYCFDNSSVPDQLQQRSER